MVFRNLNMGNFCVTLGRAVKWIYSYPIHFKTVPSTIFLFWKNSKHAEKLKGYTTNICMCRLSCFSRVWLFATPWTVAHQAPLSMGFSRQEYWSGLPCPPPGDLPNPGIKPASPATSVSQVGSLPLSHQGSPNNCIPSPQFNSYYFVMFVLFLSDIILYGVVSDIVWLYCTI